MQDREPQTKPRKPRVYFLSNVDGREAGVVALSSLKQVLELVPSMETRSVHRGLLGCHIGPDVERMALSRPGQLYVQPLSMPSSPWRPSRSRHPSYIERKV